MAVGVVVVVVLAARASVGGGVLVEAGELVAPGTGMVGGALDSAVEHAAATNARAIRTERNDMLQTLNHSGG